MKESFTDPKVEGIFLTAASRAAVDEYIQKEIKTHEAIIRYYKERHNALTVTCRLPQEVLRTILEEVAILDDAWYNSRSWNEQYRRWQESGWIKSVSHVCSHWRAVALSNSNLWSNIRLMNTAWTPEMVQRSKTTPLTIAFWGGLKLRDPTGSYMALKEIIRSDLLRIRSLTLGLVPVWASSERHELVPNIEKKRCLDMFSELLPLLDQPAPMLECLVVDLAEAEDPKQLPNGLVAGVSRLKHLRLEGWSLDWKLSAFGNLKSLIISGLSADRKPTVNQLLDMLTRTPLLESLEIVDSDISRNTPSPQDVPVCLGQLKHIDISYGLSDCAFFFDHIIFSTRATMITTRLNHIHLNNHSALSTIQALARRLANGVEGLIHELKVDYSIHCWKMNEDPTIINVYGLQRFGFGLSLALKEAFWQSLRLDSLVSLDISIVGLATDSWLFFGALPSLRNLRVYRNELALLSILEQGSIAKSDIPASFVFLKSLTLVWWFLDFVTPGRKKKVKERIVICFDRRKKADSNLETLVLENCAEAQEDNDYNEFVNRLGEYINCVNVVTG